MKKIFNRISTLTVVLLLAVNSSFALPVDINNVPENRKVWKQAETNLVIGEYQEALNNYKLLYDENPDNAHYAYKIGFCYLHFESLEDIDAAIDFLKEASKDIDNKYKDKYREDKAPPETEYYLGVSYRLKGKYEKAIKHFKNYKEYENRNNETLTDKLINREISACEYSIENPHEKYNVEKYNFDVDVDVESGKYLRCPVVSGNDSVFVYTLGDQNVYPPDINNSREQYLEPIDDIYYSIWENENWSEPKKITDDLGLKNFSMPTSLSYDGDKLFLVKDDVDDGNIYMAEFENGKWSEAKKLNKNINTRHWESHAIIDRSGQRLYFTSGRKGGEGELDLYVSKLNEEGEWGEPESLGENINTETFEETPFLLEKQNQLYFGSEAHGNMGGFDMFVTVYDSAKNKWSNPMNLGYPYNTVGNDLAYIVSFHGNFIYCPQNSNRRRVNISGSDCFSLRMPSDEKLFTLNGVISMEEGEDSDIPKDTRIAIINKAIDDTIGNVSPKNDGTFSIDDVPGGQSLRVVAMSDELEESHTDITIPQDYNNIVFPMDLKLKRAAIASNKDTDEPSDAEVQEEIKVKQILFGFDKSVLKNRFKKELDKLADYMTDNPDFSIEVKGHCDHYGSVEYNQGLGQRRADAVKRYLENKGVKSQNIRTESLSENDPVAKELKTDEARKFNRHVRILIEDNDEIEIVPFNIPEKYRLKKLAL